MRVIVLALVLLVPIATATLDEASSASAPSRVAGMGNEPLVRIAPDGTVFVSALQFLYRSTNQGVSFTLVSPAPYATIANLASDSSIDIAPNGTLYMAFDWPYAGTTAVCATATRGASWSCNPEAVPTPSDRMWVHVLPDGRVLLVTGIALDGTSTFVSAAPGLLVFVPTVPSLAAIGQVGDFAQGWGPTAHDSTLLAPTTSSPWSMIRWAAATGAYAGSSATPFHDSSIPSLARDGAGRLYGLDDTTTGITLVRNDGTPTAPQWSRFPLTTPPHTSFAAVAAGSAGNVAIVYYGSTDASTWYVYKATSANAGSAAPTFTTARLSTGVAHVGDICHSATCSGSSRFAGDFISATFDAAGVPAFAWNEDAGAGGADLVMFGR